MRRRRTRDELEAGKPDLAPMIDIVFNLLVFFMCATKLRTVEGAITAYLPKGLGLLSGAATAQLDDIRIKLLWLDAAGRPTLSHAEGHVVVALGAHRLNAPGELDGRGAPLHPVWRALHGRLLELKAAAAGIEVPVIIDARSQVPVQHVVSTLNEVVRAELTDVRFAAPEVE